MADDADVIIVGAGLAGLVAAAELAEAGRRSSSSTRSRSSRSAVSSSSIRSWYSALEGTFLGGCIFSGPQRRPRGVTRDGLDPFYQIHSPRPRTATASTIRVKLERARPTVCRALR
ncbi:FAD-binding protein [Mesorhizobium sp. AA22]|nr:FAD-binding protein [Mesorhizobium sp. AA22]